MFFCSFIIVTNVILSNVIITILLEGYLTCSDRLKERRRRVAAIASACKFAIACKRGGAKI